MAVLGWFAFVGTTCHAASAHAGETLRGALASAYRNNARLGAERARQRSDDENVPRALAGFFPTVSASVSGGPAFERDRPGTGSSLNVPVSPGITVGQTIYDGGRTASSVRSAEAAVFGGRATLRGVEQDVLLDAVTAYMDVLRDGGAVELQRSNIEFLRETLRVSRKRFETGDVSRTDPAQAEARLALGEADLATAVANLVVSRARYREVIGTPPEGLSFPDEREEVASLDPAAMSHALGQHPAVRSAMHALDMATNDVRVNASDLLPTLDVQAGLSRTYGGGRNDVQPGSLAGGSRLSVPIYDGGEASARVRQAKELVAQRRIELEMARDQVRFDLRSALGRLNAARAAIPAGEAAVAANEIALAGVSREAAEGQRTTLDVLNAQQELIRARTALLTARRDRIVASYSALAASGKLDSVFLRLRVPVYRPETHYNQVAHRRWGGRTPDGR